MLVAQAIENLAKLIEELKADIKDINRRVTLDEGAGMENRLKDLDKMQGDFRKELTALQEWRKLKAEMLNTAGQKKNPRRT